MVVVVAPRAAGLTNCNQTNWMGKEDGGREGEGKGRKEEQIFCRE